jgi:hypothetical protein
MGSGGLEVLVVGVASMESKQPEQILSIVLSAIEALESPRLRSELLNGLITPPVRQRRVFIAQKAFWAYSGTAEGDLWLFFIMPNQPCVAFAYSEEGYALLGRRWGLVNPDSPGYGTSDSWYESLIDLLLDSGHFTAAKGDARH